MKNLALFLGLFFTFTSFTLAQEAIYAVVENDTVTIWHVEALRNCGSLFKMEYEINNNNYINLYEVDTIGPIFFCMCHFDLNATLTNLNPGFYEVEVYSVGDGTSINDTTYWGSTSFTILSGDGIPELVASNQSSCYQLSDIFDTKLSDQLNVYPNPVADHVNIEAPYIIDKVFVADIFGNIICSVTNKTNELILDISGLEKGIYFISVISEGRNIFKKITKL